MRKLYPLLGIMIIILLWAAAAAIAGSYIIPPPWLTFYDTLSMLGRPYTWLQILITLWRVIAGFLLAFFAGTAVGLVAGSRRGFDNLIRPLVTLLQGIPPLLWAIPLILVFGSSELSPILVISLICFPLIALNITEGMKSIPGELKDMLKVFAPGIYGQLRELVLPHLKPFFAASLKLGLVLGIKASVIGEYFGANNGIGFQIQASFQSLQVRRLFSWGMILVLLIVLLNQLFSKAKIAGESIKRISRQRSELKCSLKDVKELKSLFLGNSSAGRICLQNVSFSYTKTEQLLSGIDLIVSEKQVAVISGESGLGKSTLINITASLLKPGSGRVIRPANLGVVFQDDRFLPWRNLCWNTALSLIYRGYNRKQALCFARYLLQEVGLDGKENLAPHELSGGMKKRLAFARCFAAFPEAILLDEPFTGLHLEARMFLWRKFFDLLHLHPVPVVIVTHFPEEIPEKQKCTFYTLSGKPAGLLPA